MVQVRLHRLATVEGSIGRHDSSGGFGRRLLRWGLCRLQLCCSSAAGSSQCKRFISAGIGGARSGCSSLFWSLFQCLSSLSGAGSPPPLPLGHHLLLQPPPSSLRIRSPKPVVHHLLLLRLPHKPLPDPMVLHQQRHGRLRRAAGGAAQSHQTHARRLIVWWFLSCCVWQWRSGEPGSVASGSSTGDVVGRQGSSSSIVERCVAGRCNRSSRSCSRIEFRSFIKRSIRQLHRLQAALEQLEQLGGLLLSGAAASGLEQLPLVCHPKLRELQRPQAASRSPCVCWISGSDWGCTAGAQQPGRPPQPVVGQVTQMAFSRSEEEPHPLGASATGASSRCRWKLPEPRRLHRSDCPAHISSSISRNI